MAQSREDGARRILIVDDEVAIARMLDEYFRMEGYRTLVAHDGREAIDLASDGVDLVLLDVTMPGMDGLEVCRRLRGRLGCPIVLLTARVAEDDQLDGFAAGADDYVTKPFSLEVLGSRVAAHLARERRAATGEASVRRFGDVTVDYGARTVEVGPDARRADLTRTEFDILALLTKSPGRVFDRDLIYERVWGWDATGDPAIVREHVRRLRAKLTAAGAPEHCLETVWGVGYRWAAR